MIRVLAAGLFCLTLMVGCGSSEGPRAKLSGKITMDGQPVTIGGINAIAEDGKGQPGVGTISTDGTYEILNAPIGKVKIWLIKPTGDSGNQTQGGKTAKMEVPDKKGYNMNEDAKDFAERMKSVAKLPKKYERPESSGLSATVDAQGTVQDLKLTTQ